MSRIDPSLKNTPFEQAYFEWLYNLIIREECIPSYWLLAKHLHRREYYWFVPNDDNRGEDGKLLRDMFVDQYNGPVPEWFDGPCSVFEMMVGLTIRMEEILSDPTIEDRTQEWFLMFLRNLGLIEYTDGNYPYPSCGLQVDEAIDMLLERTYSRTGRGGLFPLQGSTNDQTKVEIWYQLMEYLAQNYEV